MKPKPNNSRKTLGSFPLRTTNYELRTSGGFSILELLIVIAILSILGVIVLGTFSRTRGEEALATSSDAVFSLVNQARLDTLSSKGDSVYGVHFEASKAVLFKGASYSPGGLSNVSVLVHPTVTISSIVLNGGGSNVVFTRLSGATTNYGTTTISLISDSTKKRYIRIYQSGISELAAQ